MPPKRLETFTMGLPSVFHTAPPQPASNARITWSPVFVGGPDASQNGFGDSTPQSFTHKSAISHLVIACAERVTSFTPRQISQPKTDSIPIQPIKRTVPAIWTSCGNTPNLPNK